MSTAEHQFLFLGVSGQFTTLDLNLSTSSIIFGGSADASMKLTNPANVGADLTGSEVYLDVTDPDGVTVTIGPFATNENGQVTVTSIGLPGNGLLSDGGDISFNK